MSRLSIDSNGRLVGAWSITYNTPFPTKNGSLNFVEPADGVAMHTEVGYEVNVINEFNDEKTQASSFFSVAMDGHIHQYGPVGKGWKAWTQADGNPHYRGVEHEDHGNVNNPYTPAQIEATARIIDACSAHDGFPLAATDNPNGGKGVIHHSDGGAAWGGHDCPGDVRRAQRGDVIVKAQAVRRGVPAPAPHPAPAPTPSSPVRSLQIAVHTTADGVWGTTTDALLESVRHHAHTKTEQAAVGALQDGVWGLASNNSENVTIHRIQAALGAVQDGSWGPSTEAVYVKARAQYRPPAHVVPANTHGLLVLFAGDPKVYELIVPQVGPSSLVWVTGPQWAARRLNRTDVRTLPVTDRLAHLRETTP